MVYFLGHFLEIDFSCRIDYLVDFIHLSTNLGPNPPICISVLITTLQTSRHLNGQLTNTQWIWQKEWHQSPSGVLMSTGSSYSSHSPKNVFSIDWYTYRINTSYWMNSVYFLFTNSTCIQNRLYTRLLILSSTYKVHKTYTIIHGYAVRPNAWEKWGTDYPDPPWKY